MWQLASDTIGEEDISALRDWLGEMPRLTQGVLVREFESEWSRWLGVRESVMVTSGSMANYALLAVLKNRLSKERPRIGVSAVTWSTNVSPAILLGYDIVVIDVVPMSLGIDPELACEAMEAGDLDVLFVTHLLGFDALSPEVVSCANRNGVVLLEDCCEAHGARHGDFFVGNIGLGSTFSFYYGHHMSTVEGGMVCTNDVELADELRIMRGHGLARESARFSSVVETHPGIDPQFLFLSAGLNLRPTEISAFLGLRQLRSLATRILHRNLNLEAFLKAIPEGLWKDYRLTGVSSFALPLIATNPQARDAVLNVTRDLGVESRPVVAGNLLRQPFLADFPVSVAGGSTPVANHIHDYGRYVGNGHHVSIDQVRTLADRLSAEIDSSQA